MVRTNVTFTIVVLAIGVGSVSAIPLSDDSATYLLSRDIEEDFVYARDPVRAKLAAAAKAYTNPVSPAAQAAVLKLSQPQGLANAAKQASGPFNPTLVNAVVNNPHLKKKVARDILDILEARWSELEELD
ncbi:hypothetical protein Hypma_014685 [Hypsizygus marmoreus]|uniref:Uncharacterized protein n=1 Tax=Hypsizygus marmoreus TaxID=39966 RepID=A0A369JC03_HYPMA|nr:hypothetical protein Hypma_014685 [Hypsizygus marmoreus]